MTKTAHTPKNNRHYYSAPATSTRGHLQHHRSTGRDVHHRTAVVHYFGGFYTVLGY